MSKPPLTPQQVNEALKKHFSIVPEHYFDERTTAFHFTAGYAAGYAASPQREWVGLTDEDVSEVERWVEFKEEGSGQIPMEKLIRYIEAKLKEKNT